MMNSKIPIEKASFEKAYAFYRRKNDKAAVNVLAKLDQNEPRVMELKAQILYRMERFEEALDVSKKLIRTHTDEFDDLRRANLIAINARLGDEQELDLMDLDTFELQYNAACQLIAVQRFGEAQKLLEKASVECRRTLAEDGLSETEIQQEIAPILAQTAFVLQKMGNYKPALEFYLKILATKGLDWKLKQTIEENLTASYVRYGKKWRPMKRKAGGEDEQIEQDGEVIAKKRKTLTKKKRKPRLPANYDPETQPDPERWLPRQERSAYRKKLHKKFKDREIGRRTQGAAGAAGGAPASIDYSTKNPATNTVAASTPSPHPSPKPTEGPRQQRPLQQAKKNKKKKGGGGKW